MKSNEKRHVGRPATGTTKFHVAISISADLNNKLSRYAKENSLTKSAVVEKSLKDFFSKSVT
jgi:predicted transcriptional regulator